MSLELPDNAQEVSQRARVDVSRFLTTSNPFLKNSWLGGIITGIANRIFDFYFFMGQSILEALPDTAVERLEQWAAIWSVTLNAAHLADGTLVFTGTASNPVPLGTTITASDGKEYETQLAGTLTAQVLTLSSLTRVGTVATATTSSAHGLGSNVKMTITGADQAEYNVVASDIIVTGTDTFTFTVTGSPATPATTATTIDANFVSVGVPVESIEFGVDQNQIADTPLTLQSPLSGVEDVANVSQGAIGNGTDQETLPSLRIRFLRRIRNPVANFNVAQIETLVLAVAGVTRVFVQPITPAVGQVTIYFMRDGDANPIPSGVEVTEVKTEVLTIKPAPSDDDDVIVSAPVAEQTDYVFTSISPNTDTMQAAILASLQELYAERTEVEVNLTENEYVAAIQNTVDIATGDRLVSFVLSAPSGPIIVTTGKIPTLGNVTIP